MPASYAGLPGDCLRHVNARRNAAPLHRTAHILSQDAQICRRNAIRQPLQNRLVAGNGVRRRPIRTALATAGLRCPADHLPGCID